MAPGQEHVGRGRRNRPKEPHRLFWAALAAPGIIWLALLFVVPFYAILAIAGGQVDLFGVPVAAWNPLHWSSANYSAAWHDVTGASSFVGPIILRTLVYVALASLISLLIAYPAAYFVARFAGRRKALFLILLIAPFWISYMMRMLAWIDLLQTNGYVNKALSLLHLIGQPVNWLGGLGFTVVLGLVYGYIPYLILVLYAGLDRIDPAHDRSRPRSRPGPGPHLRPRHPSAVQAGDPDRDADHGAPHARRLLHQPVAVGYLGDHDVRQRDQ